jgi:fibrillarin-like rRNA methylase
MNQHRVYIEKMKHQLDELNLQMAALDTKAKDAREEARDIYRKEMEKLRHQSQLAAARMDEMKAATEDTWESMVSEMEKVRDAFVHSFKYFKSQV